jgi:two-component system chemotaxis sensor kinase CheA
VSDTLRAQLLAVYADEHRDHLAALRHAFVTKAAELEEPYRHAHSLKGAARAVDLPLVEALAHGLETLLQALWEGRVRLTESLRRVSLGVLDSIEDVSAAALANQAMPQTVPVLADLNAELGELGLDPVAAPLQAAPVAATAAFGHVLRVDVEGADRLLVTTSNLLAEIDAHRAGLNEMWHMGDTLIALRRQCSAVLGRIASGELADLGARMDAALLQHENVMRNFADREWTLAGLGETLRDDVTRLRLISVDSVLGNFGPMVREIAAQQGKQVDFTMAGMATMADRDVLQPLGEGVLHMLRNAVTHGVESPADRRAAGKDPVAALELAVHGGGGRVVVTVRDDGRGIDSRAVGRAAARRGLIDEAEAEHGNPDRLRMLLFEPGFSTAGAVTAFAGRGMGLAIIRRLVGRLQGTIDLNSALGRGTTISVTVPITLLAQRIVLVVVRGQTFGLPSTALVRLLALPRSELVVAGGRTLARIDGDEIPLVDLGALLELSGELVDQPSLCVAVMRHGAARLGLVADLFPDIRDLPVAALEPPVADDPRLGGVVSLEDGRLALVLSPVGLFSHAGCAGPLALPSVRRAAPLVLVVDDSMTIRTLEKSILQAHGYRVVLAVDGQDALARIAAQAPDLVLSDVEMPNMDGLTLLAEIKRRPEWSAIPVILVTSRDSPEDRAKGMRLGADAYVVKTRFDQEDLLETIRRLA